MDNKNHIDGLNCEILICNNCDRKFCYVHSDYVVLVNVLGLEKHNHEINLCCGMCLASWTLHQINMNLIISGLDPSWMPVINQMRDTLQTKILSIIADSGIENAN